MRRTALVLGAMLWVAGVALGNGGPFVVKYPKGDPAAKGVLAAIDPTLKPTRETRLRVVKEDLKIVFGHHQGLGKLPTAGGGSEHVPLVTVTAAYAIENPADKTIEVDFGFPILRGIYVPPLRMAPAPDVRVMVGKQQVRPLIISNSAIYGIVRQRAVAAIEKGIAADRTLAGLVEAVRKAKGEPRSDARARLAAFLTRRQNWTPRDAALLVEYASLDLGTRKSWPRDASRYYSWGNAKEDRQALEKLKAQHLGPLSAIGEQKTTQFLAHLASRFDPEAAAAYERIFTAWGGNVRESSIDLETGKVRPREFSVDKGILKGKQVWGFHRIDPTIYARVDYLDERASISPEEKASCRTVLKNLPVIFTFAPMNLLHYRATFPAGKTELLTVHYTQYAYIDSRAPRSYQLAYVVHPASLWDHFGPIHVQVLVPRGTKVAASTKLWQRGAMQQQAIPATRNGVSHDVHHATLTQKTGELIVAVDATSWQQALGGGTGKKLGALPSPQVRK